MDLLTLCSWFLTEKYLLLWFLQSCFWVKIIESSASVNSSVIADNALLSKRHKIE